MNQDDDVTMTDDEMLWAYNQYITYLDLLAMQEAELQKQHEMEMADALLSV
tara:strand:+ start:216 stop:368 length:153 start_codon:yes stop_codon:yes gene_type:complete